MITFFIKIILYLIILFAFFYVLSFGIYEIKNMKNKLGGISSIIFTLLTSIGSILVVIFA